MGGQIAETVQGKVEGTTENGISIFRGIPFAEPPVGERRFRPPVAPEAWSGTRDAKEFGPASPQLPSAIELINHRDLVKDEDCLTLNIFTPSVDDARRPVMVWIHGGAFITGTGASPWYDGASFAQRGDVVVVTINYRLGALGFAFLDDVVDGLEDSANLGLRDQVSALEWVRDNIAAFGGNPDEVTIFGESAGAMSVGMLLGTPSAKGLFKRAILQSGAARDISTREQASRMGSEIVEFLGLENPTLEALQSVPVEKILEAQGNVSLKYWGKVRGLPLQPVLDGAFITESPIDVIRGGATAGIDVLAGTTKDEWTLFTLIDPRAESMTDSELTELASKLFKSEDDTKRAIKTYGEARPEATPGDLWAAIQTDAIFRIPSTDLLEAHQGNAYRYLFTYCTPIQGGRLGSCHALEIPFVFNTLDAPAVDAFAGTPTPEMRELALAMHDAWISFARTGKPASDRLPEWPPFDSDRRATMLLGDEIEVVDDPLRNERLLWATA